MILADIEFSEIQITQDHLDVFEVPIERVWEGRGARGERITVAQVAGGWYHVHFGEFVGLLRRRHVCENSRIVARILKARYEA